MKRVPLKINSAKGGLNNRDHPSALKGDEASVLENYYSDNEHMLELRGGEELIQYAPIDPQVLTAVAGQTLALYNLDEAAGNVLDSSGNGNDLVTSGLSTQAVGLLPVSGPLGRFFQPPFQGGDSMDAFTPNYAKLPGYVGLNGLAKITMRCWFNISPLLTGKPKVITVGAQTATYSENGAVIFGACLDDGAGIPAEIVHGFTLHRDWDATAGKNASDPYIKFTLNTIGVPGTETVITSPGLPFSRWLHLKGTYDSTTGEMVFYINGDEVGRSSPAGGGVLGSTGTVLSVGGNRAGLMPAVGRYFKSVFGVLDDASIENDVVTTFPFKEPRGMGFEFAKSNGTRQAIVNAETGLYWTAGNAEWTKIAEGFSGSAFWDASQLGDILYLSNGVDTPKAWDGSTLVDWGNPSVGPVLTLTGINGPPAGTRRMKFTYLYGSYETGPSPAVEIANAAGKTIEVSQIDPRHANCTGVRIYVTKTSDLNTYYLWREIAHTPGAQMNVSGPFVSGGSYLLDTGAYGVAADASLGGAGYPAMSAFVATAAVPKGKFLLAEHRRVWTCGMENDQYSDFWSEIGAPDVMLAISFVRADTNKGPLTGQASFYGEIHASKDGNATLILRGDRPSNWRQFETLHPDVGAIDHWSYVRRYLVDTDKYVLCFAGRDGFYEYAGVKIRKVSDKIAATEKSLAQKNGTRLEYVQTTQADFAGAIGNGGGASDNIFAAGYDEDGFTQEPGRLKVMDQLSPIQLWGRTTAYLPTGVTGNKVIAYCKGADEGEFYFSTNSHAQTIYRTTDNFKTATAVLTIGAGTDFIIEMVYATIAGKANIFAFVSDTNEAGSLYRILDPVGAGGVGPVTTQIHNGLYWKSDTLFQFASNPVAGSQGVGGLVDGVLPGIDPAAPTSKGFHYIGVPPQLTGLVASNNVYTDHAQSLYLSFNVTTARAAILGSASLTGVANVNRAFDVLHNTYTAVPVGFHSVRDSASQIARGTNPTDKGFAYYAAIGGITNGFRVQFTRRESALWQGGSFRPQAFWDSTNSKLWYVAGSAEDANGNRNTTLYSHNLAAATAVATSTSYMALATDGVNAWFTDTTPDTTNNNGFFPRLRKVVLASSTLSTVGFLAISGGAATNYLPMRLSYNANTGFLLVSGKSFNVSSRNSYQWQGFLAKADVLGNFTVLKTFTQNNDAGAFPIETAYQTGVPYNHFAVMQNVQAGETVAVYKVGKNMAAPVAPITVSADVVEYKAGSLFNGVKGCMSNLLFVPSSGGAGNYLWADRIYWSPTLDTDGDGAVDEAKPHQLGVPGDWEVWAFYAGQKANLGVFTAFDSLDSDYNGMLDFQLWNGATAANLWDGAMFSTTGQPLQANNKIASVVFNPVQPWVQWGVKFTWIYSETNESRPDAPYLDFVSLGYFTGNGTLPRVVGVHWGGRTYWSVARNQSSKNNLVVCYQKNNTWTLITGWEMKSMFLFRNQLVGLEAYQFVRLEQGQTDLGAQIRGRYRSGYLMGYVDKSISGVQANVLAYINADFPNKNGYVIITPYGGDDALSAGKWAVPIPVGATKEPRRVKGSPYTSFINKWARAFAVQLESSPDTSGSWVPVIGQTEVIQELDLFLDVTGESYDLVVK